MEIWDDIEWTEDDISWIPVPQRAVNLVSNYIIEIYGLIENGENSTALQILDEGRKALHLYGVDNDLPEKLISNLQNRFTEVEEEAL